MNDHKITEIRERLEAWKSKANTCIDFNALDVDTLLQALDEERACKASAVEMIFRYGGIDGDHHRMWTLDQTLRILTGDGYDEAVRIANDGEDGPETYSWDVGIPP